MDYVILRHGGRAADQWREVYRGPEARARARYTRLVEDLRQGGVKLIAPDGTLIDYKWAPRLRTRW